MQRIMYNAEKHHLDTIIKNIDNYAQQGEDTLDEFLIHTKIKGLHRDAYNGIVDIYFGELTEEAIKKEVLFFMEKNDIKTLIDYKRYMEENGTIKRVGYYSLCELSDSTVLTLRVLENETQFVHIHPGRYSPNTFRVKANALKTAILAKYMSLCRQCEVSLDVLNEARSHMLLPPMAELNYAPSPEAAYRVLEKINHLWDLRYSKF